MIWFAQGRAKAKHGGMLALIKYPFYYIIRSCFGKFFGMIHVLTRHLAPELDCFRICSYILEVVHFCRFLTNFGACCILTGNWTFSEMFWRMVTTGLRWGIRRRGHTRKMGPKGAGLAHFGAQSVSIFFSAKYASTLICVLPKPPTRTAYINPKAAVKGGVI